MLKESAYQKSVHGMSQIDAAVKQDDTEVTSTGSYIRLKDIVSPKDNLLNKLARTSRSMTNLSLTKYPKSEPKTALANTNANKTTIKNANYNFTDFAKPKVVWGGDTLKKSKSERNLIPQKNPASVSNYTKKTLDNKSFRSRANVSVLDSVLDGTIKITRNIPTNAAIPTRTKVLQKQFSVV